MCMAPWEAGVIAEGMMVMDLDARCNLPPDGEIEVFFSDHKAKMRNSAILSLSLSLSLDRRGQMPFGHANNKDGERARLSCGDACPLYHPYSHVFSFLWPPLNEFSKRDATIIIHRLFRFITGEMMGAGGG